MTDAARPDAPPHLAEAGQRVWHAALDALDADAQFTSLEIETLLLAAGQADLVERLADEVAAMPSLATSSLPSKLSTARTAAAKLLQAINVEVDVEGAPPIRNRRQQRAAKARWQARQDRALERGSLYGGSN